MAHTPTDLRYVPGVCNIGPEEIARRRNVGWAGLVATIVLAGVLIWTGVTIWWRLLVFLPSAIAAAGFLQARFRFCAGFARVGRFNFGPIGHTTPIEDEAARARDRRRGRQISWYSALIGVVVTLVAMLIP